MTDDGLRDALRDLIPDYTGPHDPLPRILASARRRRLRHRTMLAAGGTALAAVLALAVPALVLPGHGGTRAAAPGPPAGSDGPSRVYPVAAGVVDGLDWAVGSTTVSSDARRCLISDDDFSNRQITCFDDWTAGAAVTWQANSLSDKGHEVTRITGVAPAGTASVRVRLRSGATRTLPVTVTPTDRSARFFGAVLPGAVTVGDVTALDEGGAALGDPVTDPESPCTPSPVLACAGPTG